MHKGEPIMAYDPERHHRRSIRLKGYDYTRPGAYFVTICTQDRLSLFGEVVGGQMRLNAAGKMVQSVWDEMPGFYPGVMTDEFVVMPNHVHGIIVLVGTVGADPCVCPYTGQPQNTRQPQGVAPTLSLSDVVHRFKTLTTKRYIDGVKQCGWPAFRGRLWQRHYYEHIIRDEGALERIRRYISENPIRWHLDRENPDAIGQDTEWESWVGP